MLREQRNAAQETDAIRAERPIETKVNYFDSTTKKPTWKEANEQVKYKHDKDLNLTRGIQRKGNLFWKEGVEKKLQLVTVCYLSRKTSLS